MLDKNEKLKKGNAGVTYDAARDRYRCEMRVGKISRTARCKSLADALEIRDAWAKERAELGARGIVARKGRAGALLIERRAVCVVFI